eukprot:930061-Pyramimonas_sp.AAC.1
MSTKTAEDQQSSTSIPDCWRSAALDPLPPPLPSPEDERQGGPAGSGKHSLEIGDDIAAMGPR